MLVMGCKGLGQYFEGQETGMAYRQYLATFETRAKHVHKCKQLKQHGQYSTRALP